MGMRNMLTMIMILLTLSSSIPPPPPSVLAKLKSHAHMHHSSPAVPPSWRRVGSMVYKTGACSHLPDNVQIPTKVRLVTGQETLVFKDRMCYPRGDVQWGSYWYHFTGTNGHSLRIIGKNGKRQDRWVLSDAKGTIAMIMGSDHPMPTQPWKSHGSNVGYTTSIVIQQLTASNISNNEKCTQNVNILDNYSIIFMSCIAKK